MSALGQIRTLAKFNPHLASQAIRHEIVRLCDAAEAESSHAELEALREKVREYFAAMDGYYATTGELPDGKRWRDADIALREAVK